MAVGHSELFFYARQPKNIGHRKRLSQQVFEPRVFHIWLKMKRGTPGVAAKNAATSGVPCFATVFKGVRHSVPTGPDYENDIEMYLTVI